MSEASDDGRQATERILRRAEEKGLDADRAARALNYLAARPVEYQTVEEVRPRSWFSRRFGRGVARPPS